MPDEDSFELPADWTSQGWTKETALEDEEEHSAPWGDATASLTAPDPSTAVAQSDDSTDSSTSTA